MAIAAYKKINSKTTPQSQKILGSDQVKNESGGYSHKVDDWTRLDRFLILGTESGNYAVSEEKMTKANADAVLRCIKADGIRTVDRIVGISTEGRAPKNDAALFALAMASSFGEDKTRGYALANLSRVARTGTHLLHFASFVDGFRGWGRGLRKAVAAWYESRDPSQVAFQAVKYASRDSWSQRDLLRLSHPNPSYYDTTSSTWPLQQVTDRKEVYHWITKGWESTGDTPHPNPALQLIWAYERAKRSDSASYVASLIREYGLSHEMVPTQLKNDPLVQQALLEKMPVGALIRQLPTLTRAGLTGGGAYLTDRKKIIAKLKDEEGLKKARVHPVQLLAAAKTYASGKSVRGSNSWTPEPKIIDALNDAFYLAFAATEPTGKRIMNALDLSGSMAGTLVNGVPGLSCREACGAMALVATTHEDEVTTVGFDTNLYKLPISSRQRLDDVVANLGKIGGGGTDCALPIMYATQEKLLIDAFVIYTDSESWQGKLHPSQAIQAYRKATGMQAKLIVVAMAATRYSIAENDDALSFNIVGFDTNVPALIADFIRN